MRLPREADKQKNAQFVARAEELYPVTIEPRIIGGVRTEVIIRKDDVAPRNRERVLINLHGGGFIWGRATVRDPGRHRSPGWEKDHRRHLWLLRRRRADGAGAWAARRQRLHPAAEARRAAV